MTKALNCECCNCFEWHEDDCPKLVQSVVPTPDAADQRIKGTPDGLAWSEIIVESTLGQLLQTNRPVVLDVPTTGDRINSVVESMDMWSRDEYIPWSVVCKWKRELTSIAKQTCGANKTV